MDILVSLVGFLSMQHCIVFFPSQALAFLIRILHLVFLKIKVILVIVLSVLNRLLLKEFIICITMTNTQALSLYNMESQIMGLSRVCFGPKL